MKIDKYNEALHKSISDKFDKEYPIKCKLKFRDPDPGICWVVKINFEDKEVEWSNGYVRSTTYFHNIEFIPDIFTFYKYNL